MCGTDPPEAGRGYGCLGHDRRWPAGPGVQKIAPVPDRSRNHLPRSRKGPKLNRRHDFFLDKLVAVLAKLYLTNHPNEL
jgi:hypothetical protein